VVPFPLPTPTLVLTDPATVTRADGGAQIILTHGAAFTLELGGGAVWRVTVADPAVLSGPDATTSQGTAQYTAGSPGTTTLTAVGPAVCANGPKYCMGYLLGFRASITVQGTTTPVAPPPTASPAIVQGQVVSVQATAHTIELRLPPIIPVCPLRRPCPLPIAAGRTIEVDLAHAIFDSPQGVQVSSPALTTGEELSAAGTWSQPWVLDAQVAMVATPTPMG
jgi:hypothetical protein